MHYCEWCMLAHEGRCIVIAQRSVKWLSGPLYADWWRDVHYHGDDIDASASLMLALYGFVYGTN